MKKAIQILLVDDHPLILEGLKELTFKHSKY